jgi:hypothetical protein
VTDRKEIPKSVKIVVFLRAGGNTPNLCCEGCGLRLGGKSFHYDHQIAECFQTLPKHERPPITADDVKLLGYECCHKEKSASEHKANCHGKRIVAKAARAETKKRSSFRTNRDSPYKVKMDGTVVWRETGEPVR